MFHIFAIILGTFGILAHPSVEEFQRDLKIEVVNQTPSTEKTCQIYLVHHASTEWSKIKRLQGWHDLPLIDSGKAEMYELAEKLDSIDFAAIYSSSLQSASESGAILKEKLACEKLVVMDQFRGEFHGKFEGYTREQYTSEPHFKFYKSLPTQEELFFPCGEEGESKADVALRAIPAIKKIASEHVGQNIIIVTHGGVFKLLNFYLGKYSDEAGTISIPYGGFIKIAADADTVYLISANSPN